MPFDGSGNFSRSYNWQQDRDNGIKIFAARMDGEFDNFAGGMNVVFFRNGLVPMSGNLNMGQNYLLGVGAGSVGSPSIRFADDPNSGLFLNGVSKPSIVANGVTRLEANTGGVIVTGALNSTGALTQNGQQVWHAGNLVNPASLNGAAFTGLVSFTDANFNAQIQGNNALIGFDPFDYYYYDRLGNSHNFAVAGVNRLTTNAANTTINNDLVVLNNAIVSGSLTASGGNAVWHAGNFNPGSYASLANNNVFTGDTQTISPTGAIANIVLNTAGVAGTNNFRIGAGVVGVSNGGFSIRNTSTGVNALAIDNSSNISGPGNISIGGTANITGALTQNGQQVWHAGNFNPALYAQLAGAPAAFTGTMTIGTAANNYTFNVAASNPARGIVADIANSNGAPNGAQLSFTQAGINNWTIGQTPGLDAFSFYRSRNGSSDGTEILRMTSADTSVYNNLKKEGAGGYIYFATGGVNPVMSSGTAAPSGGSNGDFYAQYV